MTYRNRCKGRRRPRNPTLELPKGDWDAFVQLIRGCVDSVERRTFSTYVSTAFAKAGFTPPSYDA